MKNPIPARNFGAKYNDKENRHVHAPKHRKKKKKKKKNAKAGERAAKLERNAKFCKRVRSQLV